MTAHLDDADLWLADAVAYIAAGAPTPEPVLARRHVAPACDVHEVDHRTEDRQLAAEMSAGAIQGDKLGVTAAVLGVMRTGRATYVLESVAVLIFESAPELDRLDPVGRVRETATKQPLARRPYRKQRLS